MGPSSSTRGQDSRSVTRASICSICGHPRARFDPFIWMRVFGSGAKASNMIRAAGASTSRSTASTVPAGVAKRIWRVGGSGCVGLRLRLLFRVGLQLRGMCLSSPSAATSRQGRVHEGYHPDVSLEWTLSGPVWPTRVGRDGSISSHTTGDGRHADHDARLLPVSAGLSEFGTVGLFTCSGRETHRYPGWFYAMWLSNQASIGSGRRWNSR